MTEFSYRVRHQGLKDSHDAHIYLSYQPLDSSSDDHACIVRQLREKQYRVTDLGDNELAKTHARYLVGGRADVDDERIFRFEFPEKPGALKLFLENLSEAVHLDFHTVEPWTVTLFHYRFHGGDKAQVLTGLRVPEEHTTHFENFLDRLGYAFTEETSNAVYRDFLK